MEKEITFNLNNYIKFKFANNGKKIWDRYYEDLGLEPKYPKIIDGYYVEQAWEVFTKIGRHLTNGMNPPIETEIIIMAQDDYKKPPLGIMPKYIWEEKRFNDIKNTIIRYIQSGQKIPIEWFKEYHDFINQSN